jgi:hypothetical protein
MLVTWARLFWRLLQLLVIEAPASPAPIDVNEQCPACGHHAGSVSCVHQNAQVMIEHTCRICGARWYVTPVMAATTDLVLPDRDKVNHD